MKETQMNDVAFGAMAHGAVGGFSRRASLVTLGTAGLAALTHPFTTEAKKRKKKRKTSTGKQAEKKCKTQTGQCISAITPLCKGDAACLARIQNCCLIAGNCDPVGWLQCLNTSPA